MTNLLIGCILQGAWLVIDYVEHLDGAVMSVIAQLLFEFRNARIQHLNTMSFGVTNFTLHSNANFIFTLDNCMDNYLGTINKSFRDQIKFIRMIKPDLRLLSEMLLFTQGFDKSIDLSKRIYICLENINYLSQSSNSLIVSINTVKKIISESLSLFNVLTEKQRLDWRYEYYTIQQAII